MVTAGRQLKSLFRLNGYFSMAYTILRWFKQMPIYSSGSRAQKNTGQSSTHRNNATARGGVLR